jgi:AGZA family xanthine/uracil permease-like MFS transporter
MKKIDEFFGISAKGSTFGTEIRAGFTTFATMIYILLVQPNIMKAAGMPGGAVFTSTALCTILATIAMGLYGKFPFALATGMGSNAIIAFSVVGAGLCDWSIALGMVFWAGLFFVLLSFPVFKWLKFIGVKNEKILNFSLRAPIVNNIPVGLKIGLSATIGIMLIRLGLGSSGLNFPTTIKFNDPVIVVTFACLVGTVVLFFVSQKIGTKNFKVGGSVLIGIAVTTFILMFFKHEVGPEDARVLEPITKFPTQFWKAPPSLGPLFFGLNPLGALKLEFIPIMFVLFMGDFFSTAGTALACSSKAGFMDKNGNIPGIERVFEVDSLATVGGALLGSTTITTFVESAAGVEDGGRTGLTSISTAFFFAVCLFFSPIFFAVPPAASGIALVIIGVSMLQGLKNVPFDDVVESIPVFVMIGFMAYTNAFADALCIALIVYAIMKLTKYALQVYANGKNPETAVTGKALAKLKPNVMTWVLLIMSVLKFVVTL